MQSVAVVGLGYWGQKVLREYCTIARNDKSVTVDVIADVNHERLIEAQNRYPEIRQASTDIESVLRDPSITCVHICTPNETHFGLALKALAFGKHVLLEKPMTMSAREAYRLIDEASERGLALQVGHIFRFNSAIQQLRDLILKGELGQIYSVRMSWTSNMKPLPERDIIFDLGPHPIDIANYALQQWPSKVVCKSKSYVRKVQGRDEEAVILLEFGEGIDALIEMSWISPGEKKREVYVRGSSKTCKVDALNQRITLYDVEESDESGESLKVEPNNTIFAEINHFLTQATSGKSGESSGLVGARTVEVLEAARQSMIAERTIHLHEMYDVNRKSLKLPSLTG